MSPDIFLDSLEELNLPFHGVRLPQFLIEDKYIKRYNILPGTSNFDFLRQLAMVGFNKLNLTKGTEEYKKYTERAKYELDTINELGFCDYFLLVWDVINFCKENDIPTGAGRGSCVSSLLLFFIGVTAIDPVKHDLYFERFISKIRAKKTIVDNIIYLDGSLLPDCDTDVCYYQRHKVLDFLAKKFEGKTCKILTLNTLSGKLLIKECGKIVGERPESEMTEVSCYIPKIFGKIKDIEDAYAGKKNDKGQYTTEPVKEFISWVDKNKECYDIALKLRGLNKNKGLHPSGVLLSYGPMIESCPMELTSDKEIVSGYDMNWASIFNIKLDILGLRSVSVVDSTLKKIKEENGKELNIDVNDSFIYQQLQDLKSPHGLFQIEADTNLKVCQKVKPRNLDELAAVISIARPGSLSFADDYAKYTTCGITEDKTDSPKLNQILNETGGCLIFQETIIRIVSEVFGLSREEGEQIRRITAKKKKQEIDKYEEIIKTQANKLGIPLAGEFFWKTLLASADYSFNKCLFKNTIVSTPDGFKPIISIRKGDKVYSYDYQNDKKEESDVIDVIFSKQNVVKITLEDGREITSSLKHKYLCSDYKMHTLEDIIKLDLQICYDESLEYFRPVPGWENSYAVSNNGSVVSIRNVKGKYSNRDFRGKQLKPYPIKRGYLAVRFYKNGKRQDFLVHRLVGFAFLPPSDKKQINHKDGVKTNNSVQNLEWVTNYENAHHALKSGLRKNCHKLTENQVLEIRELIKTKSQKELAEFYGVKRENIRVIVKREIWKHL